VAASGVAGGILLMWDKRVVSRLDTKVGDYVAAWSFKNVVDGFEWAFAGVYCPNGDCDRRLLWDELTRLLCWWDLPRCIEVISMPLGSLVKGLEGDALVQL
jgi:hypothetical protein